MSQGQTQQRMRLNLLPSTSLSIVRVWVHSHMQFFVTQWTVAHQAPLYMRLSRQEYWSRWPFPPSGDLPNPGIKPVSSASQVDSLQRASREPLLIHYY